MATFVLVHGGFHGGWCWRYVREELQRGGHTAFTPTLTGLGERVHLASKNIDLDIHVTDVVNVLFYEDLRDVVLVGHSYAAVVIMSVADRVHERLRHLVFLDSQTPEHGQCYRDLVSAEQIAAWEQHVSGREDGCIPWTWTPESMGVVDPVDAEWLQSRATPHPFKVVDGKVSFDDPAATGLPRTYIDCTSRRTEEKQAMLDEGWIAATLARVGDSTGWATPRAGLCDKGRRGRRSPKLSTHRHERSAQQSSRWCQGPEQALPVRDQTTPWEW